MKVLISFTVEFDPELYALTRGIDRDRVREELAYEVAEEVTEIENLVRAKATVHFKRLGGAELPYINPGLTLRQQRVIDEDQRWG